MSSYKGQIIFIWQGQLKASGTTQRNSS